jgi:colanic acid biosynthesis glycosyl transferase WcaI
MQRKIASRIEGPPVIIIPNPADIDQMRPLPRHNEFSRRHGLDDRVVISYAGNMGPCQGLEDVITIAEMLRERRNILFLFVGEGGVKAKLQRLASRMGTANVLFLPQQPYALVPEIYAASDISLVPLVGSIANDAIPSKVARIMACGRPVVAVTPENSDLAEMILRSGCGIVVPPGDIQALADCVANLADDWEQRAAMGQRGRKTAKAELSRIAAARAYDRLITSVRQ